MDVIDNLVNSTSTYVYNPSVTIFDNSIIVQYKKVGTRYVSGIASHPLNEVQDCYQLDLFFQSDSHFNDTISTNPENYVVHGKLYDFYLYTIFDTTHNRNEVTTKFKKFTNTKEFLNYCGVDNFTEFCFKNPKDLYFLIRNPVDRFLSGIIQILLTLTGEISFNEKAREEIKFYTKLDDRKLKDALKILTKTESDVTILDKIEPEILLPIIDYLIEKRWDLIFQDVHTENYLHNFREWMYNIEDTSKLKIIDLSQFSSNKAKEFIKTLKKDFNHVDGFREIEFFKSSNQKIYKDFISKSIKNNHTFQDYLKNENQIYVSLKKSPYFLDLSD